MKQNKTIIVLGMHRSGTSLVSGILTKLGINMGDKLFPKDPHNPFGHFEDIEFLRLNERILDSAGGHCNEPPTYDSIMDQQSIFDKEIIELIRRKSERKVWGWKDPRTSLTIDLYLPYISNPIFIFCKRNVAGVAASMYQRQKFPIIKGKQLKKKYDLFIEATCDRFPNIPILQINFEELLKEPEYWIDKIVSFTQLDSSSKQINKAVNFVSSRDKIKKKSDLIKLKKKIKIKLRNLIYGAKKILKVTLTIGKNPQ